jgi:hypothetical protein
VTIRYFTILSVAIFVTCAQGESGDRDSGNPCEHPAFPGLRACCGMPDERPGASCLLWSTLEEKARNCKKEGEVANLKLLLFCCPSLKYSDLSEPVAEPADGSEACKDQVEKRLMEDKVCTQCGNGSCGVGENLCNCPADCP